jgi:hypothetical protein
MMIQYKRMLVNKMLETNQTRERKKERERERELVNVNLVLLLISLPSLLLVEILLVLPTLPVHRSD